MKRLLMIGLVWWGGLTMARGQDGSFSKTVRPTDFSAAGLSKLSPEELARLDALVRDFKNGVLPATAAEIAATKSEASNTDLAEKLAAARREVVVAEQARAAAEAKAAKAEAAQAKEKEQEKKSELSLLARAKVLITPGTEIEYATVESRIAGDFKGWDGKTIFTMEDGARWQVANSGSYSTPPIASPKVKIAPATMGGFWLTIEGVKQRVRVVPLGGRK